MLTNELRVLLALYQKPQCGYDLKFSQVTYVLNNNTIYPLLRRLEQEDYITKARVDQEGKPSKFIYSITPKGIDRLRDMLVEFDEEDATDWTPFLYRVMHHQLIGKEAMRRIIALRRKYLTDSDEYTRKYLLNETNVPPITQHYRAFGLLRIANEMQYLDELSALLDEECSV